MLGIFDRDRAVEILQVSLLVLRTLSGLGVG